jgi:hypothetical protein
MATVIVVGGSMVLSRSLDLGSGFSTGEARLRLAPVTDGIAMSLDKAAFAGGSIAGSLTLKRLGGNASVAGDVTIEGSRIEALAPGGGLSGRASLDLRFGGSGQSVERHRRQSGRRWAARQRRAAEAVRRGLGRAALEGAADPEPTRRLAARLTETLDGGTFAAGP